MGPYFIGICCNVCISDEFSNFFWNILTRKLSKYFTFSGFTYNTIKLLLIHTHQDLASFILDKLFHEQTPLNVGSV